MIPEQRNSGVNFMRSDIGETAGKGLRYKGPDSDRVMGWPDCGVVPLSWPQDGLIFDQRTDSGFFGKKMIFATTGQPGGHASGRWPSKWTCICGTLSPPSGPLLITKR